MSIQYREQNQLYPLSKFRMCITKVKESDDDKFEIISQEWIRGNGREFKRSLIEDMNNGVHREIKVVYEKPKDFIFNQIYMLATRDVIWIWTIED